MHGLCAFFGFCVFRVFCVCGVCIPRKGTSRFSVSPSSSFAICKMETLDLSKPPEGSDITIEEWDSEYSEKQKRQAKEAEEREKKLAAEKAVLAEEFEHLRKKVKEGFFKTTLSPAGLSSGIVWVHYDPPIADEKITRELLKPGIDAVKTAEQVWGDSSEKKTYLGYETFLNALKIGNDVPVVQVRDAYF